MQWLNLCSPPLLTLRLLFAEGLTDGEFLVSENDAVVLS